MGNHNNKNPRWKNVVAMIGVLGIGVSAVAKDTTDYMSLSLEEILNMEITTASKSAEKQSDAPGIISVLTADELERFGGATLKVILERVPGLISSSVFATDATTIAPRGDQIKNTSGHVLLLINGRPVKETHDGGINSEMFNTFPVNIIDRIEVIKGPGSVLYGSDAFSAVINVITKVADKNSLSVSGVGVSTDGYGTSGSATLKWGDLKIVTAGRYLKKDWENTFSSMNMIPGQDTSATTTTTTVTVPDEGPGAYVGVNYKGLSLMSTYNNWKSMKSGSMSIEGQWEKLFGNLGYHLTLSDRWAMDFNATYTRSTVDLSVIEKKSYNLIGEWTNYITISDKSKLVVGALFNQIHGKETSSMDMGGGGIPGGQDSTGAGQNTTAESVLAEGTKNNLALYAQLDYQLRENLKLIGGTQFNKAEGIDVNVVPRAGVIWYPVPRINVKALYSSAFRAPSICELYLKIGDTMGAPDLNPEKVTTLDLGVSYQGEQSQFGVTLFHSKMTDIITSTLDMSSPDNSGASMYGNNDVITFKGIECNGAYYLNRSLYVTASILYQNNESDIVKNVSYVANLGAKAGISYVWDKGITVSLFDIYQGGMDDKYAGNLDSGSDLAYNLVHLHSKFDINKLLGWGFKPSLSLYIDVNDCFDKKYYFFDQQGGNPTIANPGREIYVGLTAAL